MVTVVSRLTWGARKAKTISRLALPAPNTFVHHTADLGPSSPTFDAEARFMQHTQAFHMDTKGWVDIAYSFVIMPSGTVYEGRGWGVVGAHTEGRNSTSHGICFAGNFQKMIPTQSAMDSCVALIRDGIRQGFVKPGVHPTGGHRDVKATACPGVQLYLRIPDMRIALGADVPDPLVVTVSRPPVKILPNPLGDGYWVVTDDGGVFSFGVPFFGSTGGTVLSAPIVDAAVMTDGQGYYLLGGDGGIFAFGSARYQGRVKYAP